MHKKRILQIKNTPAETGEGAYETFIESNNSKEAPSDGM